jgi:DNA-binding PadR family transcriptional regulator
MSVEAISWALRVPIGGNAKVVLLGLANHAHPDGTEARPSVDRLAVYAHCDRRTVQRNLRQLEAAGWISVVEAGGRGGVEGRKVTVYRLEMEGRQNATVASAAAEGGASVAERAAPASPQPSLEPSEPSEGDTGTREDRPRSVTFRSKKVPAPVVDVACRATSYFAARTHQTVKLVDATGAATDSLKRVAGAMLAHPELADPEFAKRAIDFALAAPWWKDEGPPGVGVVFGPKVVERMIEQAKRDAPPAPRAGKGDSNGDLLRELGAFDDEQS